MRDIRTPILLLFAVISLMFAGCTGVILNPAESKHSEKELVKDSLKLAEISEKRSYASVEAIRSFSEEVSSDEDYRFGPGDVMDVMVWKRPEISHQGILVAPDGRISIPKAGVLQINGMSIEELTKLLKDIFSQYYENLDVAVVVREFRNNKAFVLGRVSNPGVVNFPGNGTLLEALALAGGLPYTGTKETHLSRCAIIRGNDHVIWVDLRSLLDGGNMALNTRIQNNDVIFIPEAEDEMVMVLGEVNKPGPVMIKPGLSLIDAVMQAGGYTREADLDKVFLVRPSTTKSEVRQIALKQMLRTGHFSQNYLLEQDDVIYVSPHGMSKFNYMLEQLMPSLKVFSMSTGILSDLDSLGGNFSNDTNATDE